MSRSAQMVCEDSGSFRPGHRNMAQSQPRGKFLFINSFDQPASKRSRELQNAAAKAHAARTSFPKALRKRNVVSEGASAEVIFLNPWLCTVPGVHPKVTFRMSCGLSTQPGPLRWFVTLSRTPSILMLWLTRVVFVY